MPLSRRNFLRIAGLSAAGTLVALTGGLSLVDESQEPVVERILIPIRGLHPALEGFSIVQMSDIHLLPYTRPEMVQRSVEMANALKPDMTVLTGDYVWRMRSGAVVVAPLLAGLNARYGVYSVMGNHDYWLDIRVVQSAFDAARLPVLYNEGRSIGVGEATLYLAGVDDGQAGKPDIKLALDRAPAGAPIVMLLHEPDLADVTCLDPRVSLQLSGHTHGGQVLIPGKPPFFQPFLGKKYPYGLFKIRNLWLYTNRGLGCISVPLRINCPPEISQFILVPSTV
jgi:predicted MPP superfamily phosphohydrolase